MSPLVSATMLIAPIRSTPGMVYDPVVQRAYRECAEHYGFLISPCRPRTPEHKGNVEQGGVHYLKRNFLAGRAFRDVHDANQRVLVWCVETAGRRIHGTTKEMPLARFDTIERPALLPLPPTPYPSGIETRRLRSVGGQRSSDCDVNH